MRIIINYLPVLAIALIIVSCTDRTKKPENNGTENESSVEIITESDDQSSRSVNVYKIESGYIRFRNIAGGMEFTSERWFRNYGAIQYEETYVFSGGLKNGESTLIKEGCRYTWGFGSTEGQKFSNYSLPKNLFEELSQRDIDRYGIKLAGNEEYLGRMCQKVTTEKPAVTTQWIWEGITLKSVSLFRGQEVIIEAIEIEQGAEDESKFTLPGGVTFSEI